MVAGKSSIAEFRDNTVASRLQDHRGNFISDDLENIIDGFGNASNPKLAAGTFRQLAKVVDILQTDRKLTIDGTEEEETKDRISIVEQALATLITSIKNSVENFFKSINKPKVHYTKN